MSSLDDKASEIPSFVKKYIPGVMRGLSWAKYSDEKNKGTAMKSEALQDAYSKGLESALKAPIDSDPDRILKDTTESLWSQANEFTEEAKKISMEINNQKTKEEREKILAQAKDAARKAGLQGAIAAGWEKGWREGIQKRDSNNSD
jgi:hypothetical protein